VRSASIPAFAVGATIVCVSLAVAAPAPSQRPDASRPLVQGSRTRKSAGAKSHGTVHDRHRHAGCAAGRLRRPRHARHRHARHRHARHRRCRARARRLARRRALRRRALLRARASTLARVLATPCADTEVTPTPENAALVEAAVLCLINRERAGHGELPLRIDAQLQRAAEAHNAEMVALDYFDHVSPSGLTPVARAKLSGYIPGDEAGYVIGENIAWATLTLVTPASIVQAWIASPEHLANILEAGYRDTGIAVVAQAPPSDAQGSPGATYTQSFGVILH
jgi:uncharacterized protein YkwD